MSETKNVVIQQNNGIDYNLLYPKTVSEKKLFSYWWEETKSGFQTSQFANLSVVKISGSLAQMVQVNVNCEYYYGDNIKTERNKVLLDTLKKYTGVYRINSEGTIVYQSNNSANFNGKYIAGRSTSYYFITTDKEGVSIVDSYLKYQGEVSSQYGSISGYIYPVQNYDCFYRWSVSWQPYHNKNYVYSINRNAYPDNGEQDLATYKFLGVPFSNALFLSKSDIQV